MKQNNSSKAVALFGIIIIGPIVFMASIPWLKEQSDTVVYIATALAVAWTLFMSGLLAVRSDRASDEWERSGTRFSHLWGNMTGGGVVVLLLAFPPFHDLLVHMAAWIGGTGEAEIDRQLAIIVFAAGSMMVILAQAFCIMLFLFLWRQLTLDNG